MFEFNLIENEQHLPNGRVFGATMQPGEVWAYGYDREYPLLVGTPDTDDWGPAKEYFPGRHD